MSRKLPPLTALRAFEATARHLSMARAAEELHVTPAAVSQQIRQLEQFVGEPLFRRGRSLRLSETAEAALPLLSDAFDRLERAAARLRPDPHEGPLVVSSPPTFAARWLVPRLENFHTRCPGIELRLLATRRLVDFSLEDVDCAIRFGDGHYPGLHVEALLEEKVIPVATPNLAQRIHNAGDLASLPLLNDEWHTTRGLFPDWRSWLATQGVRPTHALAVKHYGDSNLAIQAALAGLGVALTWSSLVEDDIRAGRLVWLLGQTVKTEMAYHLTVPHAQLSLPKVAAFRDWLTHEIAGFRPPYLADTGH